MHYTARLTAPVRTDYTASELYDMVMQRGNNLLKARGGSVKEFVVDEKNREVIELLTLYFSCDPQFEKKDKTYSLTKGILLCGQMGCGKTMLMRMFQKNQNHPFQVKSCLQISTEYKDPHEGGQRVVKRYSTMAYNGDDRIGYCFDDLGDEVATGNFGDRFNMFDILKPRYADLPFNATHATTNLNPAEKDEDGNPTGYFASDMRMRDRLKEMFNIIAFPLIDDPAQASRRK